jgi:hypothetical protein
MNAAKKAADKMAVDVGSVFLGGGVKTVFTSLARSAVYLSNIENTLQKKHGVSITTISLS